MAGPFDFPLDPDAVKVGEHLTKSIVRGLTDALLIPGRISDN
jgi:hypothetical protein